MPTSTRMWRQVKEQNFWRGEIWNKRKNGEIYARLLSISVRTTMPILDLCGHLLRHRSSRNMRPSWNGWPTMMP